MWLTRRDMTDEILYTSSSHRSLIDTESESAERGPGCCCVQCYQRTTILYHRNNFSWPFSVLIIIIYGTVSAWGRPRGHGGRGKGPLKFKYHPYFCAFPQNTPPLCCHMFGDALVVFSRFFLFFRFFLTMATGRSP